MKSLVRLLTGTVLAAVIGATAASAQTEWMGPNLLANPGFEQADDKGLPTDWATQGQPAAAAKFSLDKSVFLVGTQALKAEVPGTGGATVVCKPAPVEGGKWYLVSVGVPAGGLWGAGEV